MITSLGVHPGIEIDAADGPSLVRDGEILVRGRPIGSLVDSLGFIDMVFFQLQARTPTEIERRMMDAYLVSLCEHGVTSPSTHGPRVTASVRAPFAASAMSFIATAMGPLHFGALERAMQELVELDATGETTRAFLDRRAAEGGRVWGYGHRFHKSTGEPDPKRSVQEDADPRVRALIALADALEWPGRHLARVREIGRMLHERKRIPINIDGIAAGLLLDMGFVPETALVFVMLGRLPNIARLHSEEQGETPNRFTALATRSDPGFDRTIDRDQHTDDLEAGV
mgnify:CR=1 FL=1